MIPLARCSSAVFKIPIVYVFPVPVWPYANTVPFRPCAQVDWIISVELDGTVTTEIRES